jgi:excisionase family DNA binding protein
MSREVNYFPRLESEYSMFDEGNGRVDRGEKPIPPALELMDMPALAKMLGVTHRHVQRLVSERRIPYLKVGRFIRFDPAEVAAWLEERRVGVHVAMYRFGSHRQ